MNRAQLSATIIPICGSLRGEPKSKSTDLLLLKVLAPSGRRWSSGMKMADLRADACQSVKSERIVWREELLWSRLQRGWNTDL